MDHPPILMIIDPEQGMDAGWVQALFNQHIANITLMHYHDWEQVHQLLADTQVPDATGLLIHNQQCDLLALAVLRRYNDKPAMPAVWASALEDFEREAIATLTRFRPRLLQYNAHVMQEVWDTLKGMSVRKQVLQRQQQLRGLMRLAQTVREQPEANLETYIREVAFALANITAAEKVYVIVSHGDQLQAAHCFQRIDKSVIQASMPLLSSEAIHTIFTQSKPIQWLNGTLVELYQSSIPVSVPGSLLSVPLNLFGYNKMVFCLEMPGILHMQVMQELERILPRLSAYVQRG